MVEAAQQYAVGNVGAAVVFVPGDGVVGFAGPGGALAFGPEASTVARPENAALLEGEESLFPAEVERVSAAVDDQLLGARIAEVTLHRSQGYRVVASFEVADVVGDAGR